MSSIKTNCYEFNQMLRNVTLKLVHLIHLDLGIMSRVIQCFLVILIAVFIKIPIKGLKIQDLRN
jgi:hypothetical protein